MTVQNIQESIKDRMQRGLISVDEANVEMVLSERIRVIKGRLPAQVRSALMSAVKSGKLCRIKKDGPNPEVFHHPNFRYLALEARELEFRKTIEALRAVCV